MGRVTNNVCTMYTLVCMLSGIISENAFVLCFHYNQAETETKTEIKWPQGRLNNTGLQENL